MLHNLKPSSSLRRRPPVLRTQNSLTSTDGERITRRRLSTSSQNGQTGLFQAIEALQEPLPSTDHWIHSGRLRKRVVAKDVSWQERLVVLTADALFLSRADSRRVGESISLLDIVSVSRELVDVATPAGETQRRRALPQGQSVDTIRNFFRAGSGELRCAFEIQTSHEGPFNGRLYVIMCENELQCNEWVMKIEKQRLEAGAREEASHKLSKGQEAWMAVKSECRRLYHWRVFQGIFSLLVVINFIIAIAEAQIVPEEDDKNWAFFYYAELMFTAAFAFELVINLTGHWFKPFWEDGWNVGDFVIVASSVIVIPLSELPGFTILRLFRVFRIMRLFRWMKSLRVLIRALAYSVVPVLNAFAILSIVTCLYAVIGVQLFGKKTPDRFDTFSTAFFTMVQVCTGDGWAESVVRPMWGDYQGPQVSFFFVSYMLVCGTFLLNIVVAVLLDEFITSVEKDKQMPIEAARLANEEEFFKRESPLDPLVSTLMHYTSNEDLDKHILDIFNLLDPQEKGSITFPEFQEGLKRLPFEPAIVLTSDDFEEIMHNHKSCYLAGVLDSTAFTAIMRTQLRRFVQKYLNLRSLDSSRDDMWIILALKQMLLLSEHVQPSVSDREDRLEGLLVELRSDMQELKSCLNIPARNGIDNLSPAPPTAFRSSFRSSTSFSSSMDARNISIEKPRNSSDLSEGSCAPIPSNEAWTARGPKEVEGGAGFRRPSRDDLQSPQILAHPSDASREGQPSLQPAQTSDHDIGLLPIPHRRKSTAEAGAIVTAAVIEHGVTPPRLPLDSWPCAHDETAIHGHADDDLMGAHARAASQDIHVPIHRPSHDTLSSRALPVQGHQNSSQDAVESELQAEARRGDANSGQLGVTEANMQPAAVVHTLGQVAISNIHSTSNFVWLDESRPEPGPPRLPPSMLVVGQG